MASVLPYFYVIREHLIGFQGGTDELFDAAGLMLAKLDKYYNLMSNKALLIAVVLDPRFKLQFFEERGWSREQLGALKDV